MLTDSQKGILTDWHDMMAQAYLYGANTAASKGKLSPWVPALSKDEPCNVCEESDISDYDQAAQAAFEAHSQLENEAKKPEFDAEYQAAVEKGLTDGAEGNPKEYSPKVVWWEGYRARLDQAYANGYDKAESVSGENKISKAWWIAGGIAAVVLVGVPIVFGGLLIGEGSKRK